MLLMDKVILIVFLLEQMYYTQLIKIIIFVILEFLRSVPCVSTQ